MQHTETQTMRQHNDVIVTEDTIADHENEVEFQVSELTRLWALSATPQEIQAQRLVLARAEQRLRLEQRIWEQGQR